MAHEIHFNIRGKASMAYVNEEPWHGLGQKLSAHASIDTWIKEAGMDYTILSSPVKYTDPLGKDALFEGKNVLMRSDTGAPLGLVGNKYRVVQPAEILEFFRDITESNQFELETAGVLFDGQKYWALAKTGDTARIGGRGSKDVVNGYLLLATSCDGTLMTRAQFTSVRVVCNNTLTAATRGRGIKDNGAVSISHRTHFKPNEIKQQLGISPVWQEFVDGANALSEIKVKDDIAMKFMVDILGNPEKDLQDQANNIKAVATAYQLYKGKGRGSDMKSSEGTAWGLVNAVTEYVDHLAGTSQDSRLYLGLFYDGSYLKNQAFQQALNQFVPA